MLNGSLWGVAHVLFSVEKFEIMHQSHPNKFMLTYVPSSPLTPKNKKKDCSSLLTFWMNRSLTTWKEILHLSVANVDR